MSRTIYESWHDYQVAFAQVLALATAELCIFDDNLEKTGLAELPNMEALRFLLTEHPRASVRIALRDASQLRHRQPRLVQLLRTHSHTLKIQEVSAIHVPRRDCVILADGLHAVARFDLTQPRCKLVLDDGNEVQPYAELFAEIWKTPGTPFAPEIAGLR
ncbi:MAG: hypothetical protein FWG81_02965 [Betaproteobacteria bacterium]|nr:hypothetical protein [Betaproteobacteria bacterium]